MIYHIQEFINNNFNITFLSVLGLLATIASIYVVLTKNPIVSVLYLIFLFLAISIYLMVLGFAFIGLAYLLVYVGAVSILFLFILMLINIRISELVSSTFNSIPLALVISTTFLIAIIKALPQSSKSPEFTKLPDGLNNINIVLDKLDLKNLNFMDIITKQENNNSNMSDAITNMDLGPVKVSNILDQKLDSGINSSIDWEPLTADIDYINTIGNILYVNIPMWLILTGLILLLAMVGCILITVKRTTDN